MTGEKWQTAWQIYSALREMPQSERQSFLDASSSDPEIISQVSLLLEQSEEHAPDPPTPHATHAIGSQVSRYVLLSELGRGGMGQVFSARDTELGRSVALKFLHFESAAHSEAAQKLLREAQIASALNHVNVVTIYEVIRSESSIAIVMELVQGQSLREFCKQRLPLEEVIPIGRQIARALATAHLSGIVHRDIKPENIIVRPDGCVKVLDFGLARQVSKLPDLSNASLPAGTLRYMAPEQGRGEAATSASDVFSFGLVLYELLAGQHAFPRKTPIETAHAILMSQQPGELPHDVPVDLQRLTSSMLASDASKRPDVRQVAAQLDEIQGPRKVPHIRAASRRWWIPAVAALVAIAAAGLWLTRSRSGSDDLSDLTITPLTAQAGWEGAPALSPDGDAIAFTWAVKLDRRQRIYIKRGKDNEPFALTGPEAGDVGFLAWSPDAKRIAFKRQSGGPGALYSISSFGGEEQKILDLANANLSSSIDWSPDGKLLAFSDSPPDDPGQLALYLYDLQSGEKRKLTSPPSGFWGDWSPKFSPDGRTVAFKRVTGFWMDDLYLVPTSGGAPRPFTAQHHSIAGHAWMPDGQSLLVSCQCRSTVHGIWRFALNAPARPERVAQSTVDAVFPATGTRTSKIVWINRVVDTNIYRIATTGVGKPERIIASTQRDFDAAYAPDGRIAWISDRSGSREIWIARNDGSHQRRVTHLDGPPVDNLQWSFDGRYLAFNSRRDSRSDVFLLGCPPGTLQCGEPRALHVSPAVSPAWSADGQAIYYVTESLSLGQIWKRALFGGTRVPIIETGAQSPFETSDGRWLYFYDIKALAISRLPESIGDVQHAGRQQVVAERYKPQGDGWAVTDHEVIFTAPPAPDHPAAIRAYNLTTGKVRTILDLPDPGVILGEMSLSVSKDGASILYTQLDLSTTNVMVAESNR